MIRFRSRAMMRASFGCLYVLLSHMTMLQAADVVTATGCFVKIKEEASIPARDRGALSELKVEPGGLVSAGEVIGKLDSAEAELAYDAAKIELATAQKARELSLDVEIATANVAESKAQLEQARVDVEVAEKIAESDIAVQVAESALELAVEEVKRGKAARERFTSSVSEFEIFRLETTAKAKSLDLDHAKHEQSVASLKAKSAGSSVPRFEKAVERLELEAKSAGNDLTLQDLNIKRLEKAVAMAEEHLRRREVVASIPGLIVEKMHSTGEWLEPGEPVVRIVRLDQLLIEGYVPAAAVQQSSVGQSVDVTVTVGAGRVITAKGQVVFVSPEIDPVSQEVLVRAEITNDELSMRPGLAASMTFQPAETVSTAQGDR